MVYINDKKMKEDIIRKTIVRTPLPIKEKAQSGRGMPSDLSEGETSEDWKSYFTFKWGKQIG